jgi:hypothetical protein
MPVEDQLLIWVAGVHLVGFVCIAALVIPALRSKEPPKGPEPGSDDGWGNLPTAPPTPKRWPGGGLPLPDAVQSKVRLRGPARLGDVLPRPQRRPVREPSRRPIRADGHCD